MMVWIFGTPGEIIEKLGQKGVAARVPTEAQIMAVLYSIALVAIQAALFAVCTYWLSWWYYFAFWLAPLLTIALFMNRTRVLVEHGYLLVNRLGGPELPAAEVKAVDLSAGFLTRFFVAPYQMNYHFAHHRVPSIPHYRHRDLSLLLDQNSKRVTRVEGPTYYQALFHILWN
jgi:fatty acid desaturase